MCTIVHTHFLFYTMTQKKSINWKNAAFIILVLLLIIPQTRTPIQVALNKVKVAIFSPSAYDKDDQEKLQPFNYKLTSLNGVTSEVPVGKGKVTFVSYWATWCPPCIAELPSIAALYKDYGEQVQFVLITNEDPVIVERFLEKRALNIPAVNPAMDTPSILFERSIPTNYIIDKLGNIVIKEKGAADWNSKAVRTILDDLL